MSFNTARAARLALIAVLTVTVAACATKKAPPAETPPPAQPTQPAAPQPAPRPQPPAPPPVTPPQTGPIPGSTQDFVVNVGDRVYFDTDQSDIRSDARPILDAQAAWLARYPSVTVRIEGNADERGTREYNFALGARRANAVRDYLMGKGVAAGRIETVSYGKERPIDGGSDEAAWAKNRNGHTSIVGGAR